MVNKAFIARILAKERKTPCHTTNDDAARFAMTSSSIKTHPVVIDISKESSYLIQGHVISLCFRLNQGIHN
jgi:hypothetical protein